MINGITPDISNKTKLQQVDIESFDGAMTNLLENIQACYDNWRDGCKFGSMKLKKTYNQCCAYLFV